MGYFLIWTLSTLDALFTLRLVNKYGIEIEKNPIGRMIIENPSLMVFRCYLIGIVIIGLYVLTQKGYKVAMYASFILLIVYMALFIYHLILFITELKILS